MSVLPAKQNNTPTFDIAIIGAGLSGSLCAHLLSKSGKRVCVIDKSRGSGGRAGSKRLDDDTSCDLGAPFICVKDEKTKALFKTLTENQVAAVWKQFSTAEQQAYVGIPKMSAITRHWLGDTHFITNTRIHHIEEADNTPSHWLLRDDQYQPVVIAKQIIIAIPAPQAAAILSCNPKLAVLLLRANQACASAQPQWSMWLETAHCDLNALVEPQNSAIQRMIKDNYKPMRNSDKVDRWVIHTTPAWTNQHLDVDKSWVSHTLLQAFSEETELRVLKHGVPHRWLLSRFAENVDNKSFYWLPDQNVGAVGDWLCQGDAEGAILSAIALTEHLQTSA